MRSLASIQFSVKMHFLAKIDLIEKNNTFIVLITAISISSNVPGRTGTKMENEKSSGRA